MAPKRVVDVRLVRWQPPERAWQCGRVRDRLAWRPRLPGCADRLCVCARAMQSIKARWRKGLQFPFVAQHPENVSADATCQQTIPLSTGFLRGRVAEGVGARLEEALSLKAEEKVRCHD